MVNDEFEVSITGLEKINKHKTEFCVIQRLLKWVNTDAREK